MLTSFVDMQIFNDDASGMADRREKLVGLKEDDVLATPYLHQEDLHVNFIFICEFYNGQGIKSSPIVRIPSQQRLMQTMATSFTFRNKMVEVKC